MTLRRPAPTAYLRMAFRTPAARHPDTAALLVADAILSGAKGLGFGGGAMGRSARLYRALVAGGLARSAGSDFDLSLDPYLLLVGVTALPESDPARIEAVVEGELARLREEEVSAEELARALKQAKAQQVYSVEGVTNQAFWLGEMAIVDRAERAETILDEIERVTAGGRPAGRPDLSHPGDADGRLAAAERGGRRPAAAGGPSGADPNSLAGRHRRRGGRTAIGAGLRFERRS